MFKVTKEDFWVDKNGRKRNWIKYMKSNNRNIMIIDNKVTNDKYEIGKILKEQYDKEVAEYKTLNKEESIQEIFANLLLLDQSTKRKRKLSRTISKELNHNSRTRKDVDSLFLSVSTQEARSIKPALDYSYFEGMEVFLINDWGEEVKFLKTDKDLEEVISIDFPFMLFAIMQNQFYPIKQKLLTIMIQRFRINIKKTKVEH